MALMTIPSRPTAATAIATVCTMRSRKSSDIPRAIVATSTATQRQRAAEARIRRPVGQCASMASSVVHGRLSVPAPGDAAGMGIGTSIFLIAAGAILYFAVDASVSGLDIATVGLILMICGILGLVISLFLLSSARRGVATERTVVRDRDRY